MLGGMGVLSGEGVGGGVVGVRGLDGAVFFGCRGG